MLPDGSPSPIDPHNKGTDRTAPHGAPDQLAETLTTAGGVSETQTHGASPSRSVPLDDLPRLPDYDVLEFVARGGMGLVLKARHRVLDRLAAIKVPLAQYVAGDDDRQRFLREARSSARLRHSNICTIHEVGEAGGRPYIVMDFIQGETLAAWTKRSPPTPRQAAEMTAVLARAVAYAHDHGVIHRDLKPSNVMVDAESGQPVLMDFGLAKELGDEQSQLTQSGQVVGTPAYMSPEQAAGRLEQVGPLSDVYSLGAVLYELLCRRPPFSGGVGEVIRQVQTDEPAPPRKLNARVHRDLETICLKALAKEPARRYASAAALADDLERFQAGETILARRANWGERAWRKVRRSPVLSGTMAATVLALVAVAYFGGRVARTYKTAQLQAALETDFAANEWTEKHLAEMDRLLGDLTSVAPAEGAKARRRLAEKFAEDLGREVLSPRLDAGDVRRIEPALDLLARRDPAAATRLRKELKQRARQWTKVVAVDARTPPGEVFIPKVFVPKTVRAKKGGLWRLDAAAGAALLPTTVAGGGNVEFSVRFAPSWEDTSELGLALNAGQGHSGAILSLAAIPGGNGMVTCGDDLTAKLWDIASGDVLATLRDADGPINGVAVLSDGKTLATAGHRIKLCDARSGKETKALAELPGPHLGVSVSTDGKWLAAVTAEGQVRLWDLPAEKPSFVLEAPGEPIRQAEFSPDGTLLLTGSASGPARLWDVSSGKLARVLGENRRSIMRVAFSPDGRTAAAVSDPAIVHLYDAQTGAEQRALVHNGGTSALAFSPQSEMLATGQGSNVVLWDLRSGEMQPLLLVEEGTVTALAFSSDGERLIAATDKAALKIWNSKTRKAVATLRNTGYAFLLRAVGEAPASEEGAGQPAALRSAVFRDVRKAHGHALLEIRREGAVLHEQEVPAAELPGGALTLTASRQGNKLTLRLGRGPATLEFYDVFPISQARPGVFGVYWPAAAGVESLEVLRQTAAQLASPLERGDELFDRGQYAEALEFYRQQSLASAGQPEAQESHYKEGLCLAELGRTEEANNTFEQLAAESGERWPTLAACQVWVALVDKQKWTEADDLIEVFSVRNALQPLASLVPGHIRRRILSAYQGRPAEIQGVSNQGQFASATYYKPDPNRIRMLQRAMTLEDLFAMPSDTTWGTRWALLRAYHAAGRIDEALQLAERVLGEADLTKAGAYSLWVEEYCWLLRGHGEGEKALAVCDEWRAKNSEAYHLDREILWLERARILGGLGRWEEAEQAIETLFQQRPAEKLGQHLTRACLVRGFLREQRGDAAGALEAWRMAVPRDEAHPATGMEFLHWLIAASLTRELTDPQAEQVLGKLIASFAPGSPAAMVGQVFHLPPGVLRDMWLTPRGHDIARRIAFREISFAEFVRLPPVMILSEVLRQRTFAGNVTPEQDELIWNVVQEAYTDCIAGKIGPQHAVGLAMTWKGQAGFLGWAGVAPSLDVRIRGPLAYVMGHHYLRLNKPKESAEFFRTALELAEPGSTLERLAKEAVK